MATLGSVQSAYDLVDKDAKLYKRHTSKIREYLENLKDESPELICKTLKEYLQSKDVPVQAIRMLTKDEVYRLKIGVEITLLCAQYQFTIREKTNFDELYKSVD
jgi:hypothetical protein